MSAQNFRLRSGFALIEALVALSIVAIGMLAIAKVQTKTILDTSEASAQSEASKYSATHTETLANNLTLDGFTNHATSGLSNKNPTFTTIRNFETETVPQTKDLKKASVATMWTDVYSKVQAVVLNTLVAWDNPVVQWNVARDTSNNLITPSGAAHRGDATYRPGDQVAVGLVDNVRVLHDASIDEEDLSLSDAILYLEPDEGGNAQNFVTILGKVYFDQVVNQNVMPNIDEVFVRLSTEGICVYDNRDFDGANQYPAVTPNYKFFEYQCYVGPGWYGNVGIMPSTLQSPNVCVGDPTVSNDGTTTSTIYQLSAKRTYRGFKNSGDNEDVIDYQTTGVLGGAIDESYPPSGTIANPGSVSSFSQDFLITRVSGNETCQDRMDIDGAGDVLFSDNAGAFFCITPDEFTLADDLCPSNWPGFSGVASGNCAEPSMLTVVSGSAFDKHGEVVSSPSDYGGCLMQGNTANYSCELCSLPGSEIVLINERILPSGGYCYVSDVITLSGGNIAFNFTGGASVCPSQ